MPCGVKGEGASAIVLSRGQVHGHLGIYFLTIMQMAAIKISLQVFVCLFITFGQIPESGIDRSHSKCASDLTTAKLGSDVGETFCIPAAEDKKSSCSAFSLTPAVESFTFSAFLVGL